MQQPFLIVLLLFVASLPLTMTASAWFTRRLEAVCDILHLPPSLLSLLGALGANIPNYAASIVAIAGGHVDIGLGIILGSNIYNIAIILSIASFVTPRQHGIVFTFREAQDARVVAGYSLAVMVTTVVTIWLLPGTPLVSWLPAPLQSQGLLLFFVLITLLMFGGLVWHALGREHIEEKEEDDASQFSPHAQEMGERAMQASSPVDHASPSPTGIGGGFSSEQDEGDASVPTHRATPPPPLRIRGGFSRGLARDCYR